MNINTGYVHISAAPYISRQTDKLNICGSKSGRWYDQDSPLGDTGEGGNQHSSCPSLEQAICLVPQAL